MARPIKETPVLTGKDAKNSLTVSQILLLLAKPKRKPLEMPMKHLRL